MANFIREDKDIFFWPKQDPQPYLFEPEYTEEVLHVLEAERAEERLRQSNSLGLKGEYEPAWTSGVDVGLSHLCGQKMNASAVLSRIWCFHRWEGSTYLAKRTVHMETVSQ